MTKTLEDFLEEMSEHVFQDENGRLYHPIIKEHLLNRDYLLVAYFGKIRRTKSIPLNEAKKHQHIGAYSK